jgi:hypothetical protein
LDDAQDFLFHPIKRWKQVSNEVVEKQAAGDCLGAGETLQEKYVAPVTVTVIGGVEMVRGGIRGLPKTEAPKPPPAITWVDEGGNLRAGKSAGMPADAYEYQSHATGARSNALTGRSQASLLEYTDANGQPARVKFDGVDGTQLIDRKTAIHTGQKTQMLAQRQSAALSQHGLTGVWEVPNAAEAARAGKVLRAAGVTNITVRIKPR